MSQVIKVASWNVNSLRIRLPHVTAFLQAAQPDVLCLQETKVEDALFPTEAFTALGYHAAFHGQKSYNGVALLSRQPLADITLGFANETLPDIFQAQARLMAGTLPNGVRVASAYVPNGESPASEKFVFKEGFYQHLTAYVQNALKSAPDFVLCGDFNIAADARDIANPERSEKQVLFTPQERQWLADFCEKTTLADSFRQVSQEEGVYSWYDYRTYGRNPKSGARIDYLFTSPSLTPKIQNVEHFQEERTKPQPSDHLPVLLELAL